MGGSIIPGGLSQFGRCRLCAHCVCSRCLYPPLCVLQVSASAGRGFFATSKFCGPAGFRRSTFSEGIALRWAMVHGGGDAPLCAHAMQHALLQGMAPHGAQVY